MSRRRRGPVGRAGRAWRGAGGHEAGRAGSREARRAGSRVRCLAAHVGVHVDADARADARADVRAGVRTDVRAGVRDRGAVTAELAVGMVAVAAVLVAVLATGAATLTRLTCLDAARTGARVAALGEPDGEVTAAARRILGDRAGDVRVVREDGWVTVTVSAPFTGWPGLDGAHARASATGWSEP